MLKITNKKDYFDSGFLVANPSSTTKKYFYTHDHLGSVREVVDETGAIKARYDYSPFGVREKVEGDASDLQFESDFGFTGHHTHNKSGLVLTLYRAYDPNLGRWLSADPIGEAGGLNLYGYVINDPINWVDLWGLIRYGIYTTGANSGAFNNRAEQGVGTGNARGVDSGEGFIDELKSCPNITRVDVHSHGYANGVIGAGTDNGFYRGSYGESGSANISDFINAVSNGDIDLAPNAEINFYGCNNDELAQDLSQALGDIGRGDVSVTGADNKVYPNSSETGARVDHRGNFNSYKNGRKTSSSRNKSYR